MISICDLPIPIALIVCARLCRAQNLQSLHSSLVHSSSSSDLLLLSLECISWVCISRLICEQEK